MARLITWEKNQYLNSRIRDMKNDTYRNKKIETRMLFTFPKRILQRIQILELLYDNPEMIEVVGI